MENITQEETTIVQIPEKIKSSWFWIKDTNGNASVTATMLLIAFIVTTLAYVLSIVEKLGPITIRPFDVGACSAYFVPIMTLYFGRRWTDAKTSTNAGDK